MTAPTPSSHLTPLPRLGDWILRALLGPSNGELRPEEVVDWIGEQHGSELTDSDREPDPERPGFTLWQSRVYLARRYLGEDQLVLSDRRHWRLTEAGRLAADQVSPPTAPDIPRPPAVTRAPEQRSLMQRSQLSTPLLDPDERARIGLPVAEDAAIPVVIELNLSHAGGSVEAYQTFIEMWRRRMPGDPVPERFEEYVRASISMAKLRDFIRDDQVRSGRRRVIHRVWPDFPVETLEVRR